MPTFYMVVGIPASGKSTWITQQPFDWSKTAIISSDAIIDRRAAEQKKTYNDVFQKEIKSAIAEMQSQLKAAISQNMDIILDQTNVTAKSRASKLAQIPDSYEKVAVFFATPSAQELTRRLNSRPGKNIPAHIVQGMASQLEKPTKAEGFDRIVMV